MKERLRTGDCFALGSPNLGVFYFFRLPLPLFTDVFLAAATDWKIQLYMIVMLSGLRTLHLSSRQFSFSLLRLVIVQMNADIWFSLLHFSVLLEPPSFWFWALLLQYPLWTRISLLVHVSILILENRVCHGSSSPPQISVKSCRTGPSDIPMSCF